MRSAFDLHDWQIRAINWLIAHPNAFIWAFMGAGKTIMTETAVAHLIQHRWMRAALVVGPLRVVQSGWASEAKQWEHVKHLRFSLIHGTPDERVRALFRPADIYLINYEGLPWLADNLFHYFINRGTQLPFDTVVWDESPKMKNSQTRRVEAVIPLLQYLPRRWGLTGTPASNGLQDLFGQFLVVDAGARFGIDKHHFESTYFQQGGFGGYKYAPTDLGKEHIYQQCADIVMELNEADYVKMPDLIFNDIYVDLNARNRAQYEELEMQLFTQLDNGEELEVKNEAAKSNKCLQFSNGAAYTDTETREWHPVHDAKLDALEDIIEESGGEPILLAYNYRPDAHRIMKKFPFAVNLTGMSGAQFNETLELWKAGNIRLLLGHPASMGHGVDGLQKRGHTMVWFGLNWSLELYLQFNARLRRQGQQHPVICHRILTRDTLDDAVRLALEGKTVTQNDLRAAVAQYREEKRAHIAA